MRQPVTHTSCIIYSFELVHTSPHTHSTELVDADPARHTPTRDHLQWCTKAQGTGRCLARPFQFAVLAKREEPQAARIMFYCVAEAYAFPRKYKSMEVSCNQVRRYLRLHPAAGTSKARGSISTCSRVIYFVRERGVIGPPGCTPPGEHS